MPRAPGAFAGAREDDSRNRRCRRWRSRSSRRRARRLAVVAAAHAHARRHRSRRRARTARTPRSRRRTRRAAGSAASAPRCRQARSRREPRPCIANAKSARPAWRASVSRIRQTRARVDRIGGAAVRGAADAVAQPAGLPERRDERAAAHGARTVAVLGVPARLASSAAQRIQRRSPARGARRRRKASRESRRLCRLTDALSCLRNAACASPTKAR